MTRRILRNRARLSMKRAGLTQINKHPCVKNFRTGSMERTDSYFAEHWRDYALTPVRKPRKKTAPRDRNITNRVTQASEG